MSIQVNLFGRLGTDPEMRMAGNNEIATASVAVSHDRKKQGQDRADSDWYRLNVWNKQASFFQEHFKKGSRIYVSGSLEINTYTDKNGNERETKDITVNKLQIIDWDQPQQAPQQQPQNNANPFSNGQEVNFADDDLPF